MGLPHARRAAEIVSDMGSFDATAVLVAGTCEEVRRFTVQRSRTGEASHRIESWDTLRA